MAAITSRLLRLRSNLDSYLRPYPCPIHHHFSSSSEPPPTTSETEADSETRSSFSSFFKDVKSSLQKEPPRRNPPQSPRVPISFSNPTLPESPPSKIASLKEISKHLSEFRRLSASPPPSSDASGQPVSLQELYKRNVTDGSDYSAATPLGPAAGGKPSFDVIRESIRQLRSTAPYQRNRNDSNGNPIDPLSLARYKESLKLKSGEMNGDPVIIGGSDTVPASIFGKDKNGRMDKGDAGAAFRRTGFVLTHSYLDLGKKLEMLRPENKKGKWFSLQELNERLVKMREIENEEMKARNSGIPISELRETLQILTLSNEEQARKNTMQRFEIMGHLGGTPDYMLSSPKEHLVERYFHPDHMSSAEKLKLELKKVRDEFKMSESDCGSTRVQVAQLTTKIKHLSTVLRKKDKHSRKGLQEMVQRRKKLLKYLRRTDWDSYCLVLSKLGLRDNTDFKA